MKREFDPKVFYGIIAVVVVGVAFLVYKGANSSAVAPLPNAKMFIKQPGATGLSTASTAPVPPSH